MKILVIGNGGREHALCWKLAQSTKIERLYCAPGNPGTAAICENVPLAADDLPGLLNFALEMKIDLTVVGPELPLTRGLVDLFQEHGLTVFGPVSVAAKLEGSKAFAKEIMSEAGIATAAYETFSELQAAKQYVEKRGAPIVVKADGLAAGKGVVVARTVDEALTGLEFLFHELQAREVVIEDFLDGIEVSYIVATDGERIVRMASSHDYKRIGTGDQGPNTGGMGSVSPSPRLVPDVEQRVVSGIIETLLSTLRKRGIQYTGFLYAGLMINESGDARVLEFNVRMGDPECQAILSRLRSDLALLLFALAQGPASPLPDIQWHDGSSVNVVLAAAGYPEHPRKGDRIDGIDLAARMNGVQVFHAGTEYKDNQLITSGGRVLSVVALGEDLAAARERAYRAADLIQFAGRQMRRDIGA